MVPQVESIHIFADHHAGTDTNPVGMMISYLKRMEGLKIGQYEAALKARELKRLYSLEEISPFIADIDEARQSTNPYIG